MDWNLNGTVLVVASAEYPGLADINILPDGTKALVSGVCADILHDLQLILNFSVKHVVVDTFFPTSITYAEPLDTPSIAYQLATSQADIAAGMMYHVLPRLKYGTLLSSYGKETFYAYFKPPSSILQFHDVYQKPLGLTFMLIVFTSLILLRLMTEVVVLLRRKREGFSRMRQFLVSVIKSIDWATSSMSQQGTSIRISSIPFQFTVLLAAGIIMTSLIYIYYSASILSYFNSDIQLIHNFSDSLKFAYTLYADGAIKGALLPEAEISYNFLQTTQNNSLLKLFAGGHIHLDSDDIFYPEVRQHGIPMDDVCKISKVRVYSGGELTSGYFCRFGFPHKDLFNAALLKIYQTGLTGRYIGSYYRHTVVKCPKRVVKYQDDLGFEELNSIFIYYLWSFVSSIVILFLEKLIVKLVKK